MAMTSPSRAEAHEDWCNCYDCEDSKLDGRQRKRRPSDATDMDLDELVASQESGKVPGDAYRAKNERPWGIDPSEIHDAS